MMLAAGMALQQCYREHNAVSVDVETGLESDQFKTANANVDFDLPRARDRDGEVLDLPCTFEIHCSALDGLDAQGR